MVTATDMGRAITVVDHTIMVVGHTTVAGRIIMAVGPTMAAATIAIVTTKDTGPAS